MVRRKVSTFYSLSSFRTTEEKPKEDLSAQDNKQGLKQEEGEESDWDFDDWKGVSREGRKSGESDNEEDDEDWNDNDDDDQDGGVMMPVPDASF